jgi:hypothetical protein
MERFAEALISPKRMAVESLSRPQRHIPTRKYGRLSVFSAAM